MPNVSQSIRTKLFARHSQCRRCVVIVCSLLATLTVSSIVIAQITTKVATGTLGKLAVVPLGSISGNKITETKRDLTSVTLGIMQQDLAKIDTFSSNPDVEVRAVGTAPNQPVQIIITGVRAAKATVGWSYSTTSGGDGGYVGLLVEISD